MGCGGSKADGEEKPAGSDQQQDQAKPKDANAKDVHGQGLRILPKVSPATTTLDASENELPELPAAIGELTALTSLDVSDNKLTTFPAEIGQLTAPKELLAYKNEIKELPKEFGDLSSLNVLNLFNNKLKKVPNELGKLTELQEVNISGNKMMMIMDAPMAGWSKVTNLQLSGNNLVRLGSLAVMVNLEELRLYDNNLEDMPTIAANMPALSVMEVHKNRFSTMPDEYFTATPALTRLTINNCQLTTLPSSLLGLSGLVNLQAFENAITTLPAGAWPLKIETLFLHGNTGLTALPSEIGDLTALSRANFSKLDLDDASVAITEKVKLTCLAAPNGRFWDVKGRMMEM